MRRTASEILRDLEIRIARLEKQAKSGTLEQLQKFLFKKHRIILHLDGQQRYLVQDEDVILRWDHRVMEDQINHGDSIEVLTLDGIPLSLSWRYSR